MIPRFRPMIAACVPIVGVQLRQNALDTSLDGVLGDVELIGNLLVRVPGRDEAQHDHFGRCQRLIADMLSDLESRLRRQTPLSNMDRPDRLQ
jgi:hypothetical protein